MAPRTVAYFSIPLLVSEELVMSLSLSIARNMTPEAKYEIKKKG
jgi:hypothetical protein